MAAAAIVAVVGACGPGGPSAADYVKKADPVCGTANTQAQQLTKPADLKQVSDVSGKLAGAVDTQAKGLAKLEQPKKNRDVLQRVLKAMQDTAADANGLKAAADGSNVADVEAKGKAMVEHATAADNDARLYGLTRCGGPIRDKAVEIQSTLPSMLKQDFIAKADLLCADANRKFDTVPTPSTAKQFLAAIDQTLSINDKLVSDLRSLYVPEADRPAFEDVLAANAKVVDALNALKPAVQSNDAKQAETLGNNVDSAIADANKKADAFGFKDCGTPSQ